MTRHRGTKPALTAWIVATCIGGCVMLAIAAAVIERMI